MRENRFTHQTIMTIIIIPNIFPTFLMEVLFRELWKWEPLLYKTSKILTNLPKKNTQKHKIIIFQFEKLL